VHKWNKHQQGGFFVFLDAFMTVCPSVRIYNFPLDIQSPLKFALKILTKFCCWRGKTYVQMRFRQVPKYRRHIILVAFVLCIWRSRVQITSIRPAILSFSHWFSSLVRTHDAVVPHITPLPLSPYSLKFYYSLISLMFRAVE
jgi:hypothetical protein